MGYKSNKKALLRAFREGGQAGLSSAAVSFQSDAKTILSRRSGPPPSPVGQPPAKRTGTLGRSIQIDRSQIRSLRVRVGTNLVYARVHELGTNGARRPFLRATLDKQRRKYERLIVRGIAQAIAKVKA